MGPIKWVRSICKLLAIKPDAQWQSGDIQIAIWKIVLDNDKFSKNWLKEQATEK